MREAHYRAWTGNSMCVTTSVALEMSNYGYEKKGRWELMQGTGVKDINGKEVFEGDIVEITDKEDKITEKYHIVYTEFDMAFKALNNDGTANWWDDETMYKIEVIGNIFENPSLID